MKVQWFPSSEIFQTELSIFSLWLQQCTCTRVNSEDSIHLKFTIKERICPKDRMLIIEAIA